MNYIKVEMKHYRSSAQELSDSIFDYLVSSKVIENPQNITIDHIVQIVKMVDAHERRRRSNHINWLNWWGSYIHGEHQTKVNEEFEECPHMACSSIQETIKELRYDNPPKD